MPNGGYPRHLLLPMNADLALRFSGAEATLQRLERPAPGQTRPSWTTIGDLSAEQLRALLFHLDYWGGNHDAQHGVEMRFLREQVRPQYHAKGCLYDY